MSCSYQFNLTVLLCHSRSINLLTFCLEELSIDVSGMVKSPTIIVFLSVFPFMYATICFIYLDIPIFGARVLRSVICVCVCVVLILSSLYSVFLYDLCFKAYVI